MPTILKPVVSQWYRHLNKGQQFYVTALDEEEGTVELQHFDGDLEEMDIDDWHAIAVEPIEQPEDWTGPVDDIERDDLGYSETDMTSQDWQEPLEEKGEPVEGEEEERREE
ncbi:MAG: hypothetical protein Q7J84_17875 [Sulfuricaulis sp.]|nr:hypothetical protein [Sulfuricaulis sp.]